MTFEEWERDHSWIVKELAAVQRKIVWVAATAQRDEEVSKLVTLIRQSHADIKRAAAMLAMLAERDGKGRKTIDDFADALNEHRIQLEAALASFLPPAVPEPNQVTDE